MRCVDDRGSDHSHQTTVMHNPLPVHSAYPVTQCLASCQATRSRTSLFHSERTTGISSVFFPQPRGCRRRFSGSQLPLSRRTPSRTRPVARWSWSSSSRFLSAGVLNLFLESCVHLSVNGAPTMFATQAGASGRDSRYSGLPFPEPIASVSAVSASTTAALLQGHWIARAQVSARLRNPSSS